MSEQEKEKFVDSCHGCYFANYKTDDYDFTDQCGCDIGRLQRFIDLDLARLSFTRFSQTSYSLKKKCNYKVTGEPTDVPLAQVIDEVRSSNRIKTAAVIVLKKKNGVLSFVEIARLLTVLTQNQVGIDGLANWLYEEIVLVNNNSDIPMSSLQSLVEGHVAASGHANLHLVRMMEDANDLVAVDEGVSRVKNSHFYTVVAAGEDGTYGGTYLSYLPQKLNFLINERLEKFVAVCPKVEGSLNGLTVHTVTHRLGKVGGNAEFVFEDEQGNTEHISLVTDKLKRIAEGWELKDVVVPFSVIEG